jgi:hypothetical protein
MPREVQGYGIIWAMQDWPVFASIFVHTDR